MEVIFMADHSRSGKSMIGLGLSGKLELQQKLIMTPRVRKKNSDEEAEKRLLLPPKREVKK
jgi:hypothetical protein